MAKQTFVYGAMILLGANFLNRILGFVYQYLIMTKIGGESLGLFNMVFPVYMMALVLTTAGIPIAIAKLVSEEVSKGNPGKALNIFRLALAILCVSGAIVALSLYFLSPYLADKIFPDPRVANIFLICTPAIFIVSVASAFRGYFQGMQNMFPTAVSQICEQLVRVSLGFFLSLRLLDRGPEWAAIGLALGMLAGEVIGLTAIVIQYAINRRKTAQVKESKSFLGKNFASLFKLAYPITLGRLLSTGISSLDAVIIPQRLQAAGYTAREATTLFGQMGGSAFTLLTFPSVFTAALATSLIPSISEATAKHQWQTVRSRSSEAIRLTVIIGIPCLLIMHFYSDSLTSFFKSPSIAPILRILTAGGLFTYLQQTSSGILQGMGKMHLPVINSIISATVRIPTLYVLTALPYLGLKGVAWAYVLGYLIMACLNIGCIIHFSGMALDLQRFILQPLSAGIGMLLVYKGFSYLPFHSLILQIAVLLIGITCYAFILYKNGGLSLKDFRRLPWIGKFIR